MKLDPDCFRAWCNCNGGGFPQLVTEANPYVFASKNVEAAKDVIGVDTDLADADPLLLAKIYLFDAFIHNTDRTDYNSNLLVNHGVHVIDHNNAFDGAFDKRLFANEHILRSFFERTSPSALSSFEQELRDTASPTFLGTIWSEMPDEWRDVGEAVFSPKKVMETTSTRCAP